MRRGLPTTFGVSPLPPENTLFGRCGSCVQSRMMEREDGCLCLSFLLPPIAFCLLLPGTEGKSLKDRAKDTLTREREYSLSALLLPIERGAFCMAGIRRHAQMSAVMIQDYLPRLASII